MPESLDVVWRTTAPLMAVTEGALYTHWRGVQSRRPETGDVLWETPELDPGIAVDTAVIAATNERIIIHTGHIHGHRGAVPAPPSFRELSVSTGAETWTRPTSPHADAALLGDTLVGVGEAGELVGISSNGALSWARDEAVQGVVATNGTGAAFNPSPDRLVLINADGSTRWDRQHDPEAFRFLHYSGEGLVVSGRTVDAYNLEGEHLAHYRSDDPRPSGFVRDDDCVILTAHDLLAVRGDRVIWSTRIPDADTRGGSGACNEVRVEGDICVATTDRGAFAVDSDSGEILWVSEFHNGADVVEFDGDRLYTNGLGGFRVHDRSSGRVVATWLIEDPQAGFHRPVPMGHGRILLSLANGDTSLVELAD